MLTTSRIGAKNFSFETTYPTAIDGKKPKRWLGEKFSEPL
jgi:hypothetical protein